LPYITKTRLTTFLGVVFEKKSNLFDNSNVQIWYLLVFRLLGQTLSHPYPQVLLLRETIRIVRLSRLLLDSLLHHRYRLHHLARHRCI